MSQSEINPEKRLNKSSLKPVLLSILILISGIIIGSGTTLIMTGQLKTKPVPQGWEQMSGRMIQRIIRELHLSPQQQEKLDPIVKQHMEAMDTIRQEARPKIKAEIEQMNDEIMTILDDGQKQIWKDQIQRMQDRFNRMRHRRGPEYRQKDQPDPNSRPDGPRPSRRFHNRRPPEDRERPHPPLPGGPEGHEPIPEEPPTE